MAWLSEFFFLENFDFFVNDEKHYINAGKQFLWPDFFRDRGLWYLINYYFLQVELPFAFVGLKIINIFILFFAITILSYCFADRNLLKSVIIFLPYFLVTSIYNIRDNAILFCIVGGIYFVFKKNKSTSLGVLLLSLLLFLRPILFGLICFIILVGIVLQFFYRLFKFQIDFRTLGFLIVFLLIFVLGASAYIDVAVQRGLANWESGGKRFERIQASGFATGNRGRDLLVAMLRFSFAPMPQSLAKRLLISKPTEWGIVTEIVRIWNQFGYFLLLFFILLHWKWLFCIIKSFTFRQKIILLCLLMYLPIYSLHLYGVCHQRLKLPFQLATLILARRIYRSKKGYAKIN